MIEEFYQRLESNSDLQFLVVALHQISQFSQVQTMPSISEQQIELLTQIVNQHENIRKDKLRTDQIENFQKLISQIENVNSTFYQSCVEQNQKHLNGLEIHAQNSISQLSLKSMSVSTIHWLKDVSKLLPNIIDTLINKLQEAILKSLIETSDPEIEESEVIILVNYPKIVVYQKDDQLCLKANFNITKQSEMIQILCGYLQFFDHLQINLSEFIVTSIAQHSRSHFIKLQNVIIDEIIDIEKFDKQITQCVEQAKLIEIVDKSAHYSQLDKLKQNLVRFKNFYVDAIEKLDFKNQKQQNWNLNIFKQKTQNPQKSFTKFFTQLSQDCNVLDNFIKANTESNEQIFQLIFDHLRLLDICLQMRKQEPNFQSLNFYVSIYTQIDSQLIKLLKVWDDEQLLNYIYNIKYQLRQLSNQASDYVDL